MSKIELSFRGIDNTYRGERATVEQRKFIVVVEDDPEMNRAIRRLLNAAGFRTVTFFSADAFLLGDTAAAADCLILDIHMPGLSGLEVPGRLRARGVRTPIIFVTAYDDPVFRARAEQAGAAGYLAKPFRSECLLAALASALQ